MSTPTAPADQAGGKGGSSFTVRVETLAWIRTFVGGPASGSAVFDETARPGDTIRAVLKGLSGRFPRLAEVLWEGEQLGPHIEVIVNETILGKPYQLDSPVQPGDEIILTGQYIGG